MVEIHITDIIPLIGIPDPPNGRRNYNIACPCCDNGPRERHLNINLNKDVFCCPRCHFSGGVFDLYAYYANVDRTTVREVLIERLGLKDSGSSCEGSRKRERRTPVQPFQQDIELPLTDIDARHETYTALLSKLSLASDHRENLLKRGLTDEKETGVWYRKNAESLFLPAPRTERSRVCRYGAIISRKVNSVGYPVLVSRTAAKQKPGHTLQEDLRRPYFLQRDL